jgi:diadenosine tetraphosphate (Ap4A) HIT family hydrolase
MGFNTIKYRVLETPFWAVNIAEDDQTYLGRCYVALKRPCGTLSEITQEEFSDFLSVVKRLEKATTQAFGATMHNWTCLMNNAYQVEPAKPQVHWHFRPRYKNIVKFAGEEFRDKEFGYHYERKPVRPVSDDLAAKIIAEIQRFL